jgi:hypothetical protein
VNRTDRIGWALALSLALAAWITTPTAALADSHEGGGGPAVTQVIIVDVEAQDMDAYMGYVKRAQGLAAELGLPPFRVLQAAFAGENAGAIAILVESANLGVLAQRQGVTAGSDAWQKLISEIQNSGTSDVRSNSIWVDVTP